MHLQTSSLSYNIFYIYNEYMILTAKEIEKEVKKGNIIITPFSRKNIKPNSYIYSLSPTLIEIKDVGDKRKKPKIKEYTIPKSGFVLEPNKLYLGTTVEEIGSKKFVTSLIGRNSIAKLGMFLQITADLGQLGKAHKWTLEIKVVQRLRIYPNMKVGQVTFWVPKGDIDIQKTEFYAQQDEPYPSQLYNEK